MSCFQQILYEPFLSRLRQQDSQNHIRFAAISRAEFLLPDLGSIIMGLSLGFNSAPNIVSLVMLILVFFCSNQSELGNWRPSKHYLWLHLGHQWWTQNNIVTALSKFGQARLKAIMSFEAVIAFLWFFCSCWILEKWFCYYVDYRNHVRYFYSAPPLRIKSRSWLAPITLILVLAVLPVLFEYFIFVGELTPLFLISLIGLGLTVYAVIVPTGIRDYFGDKVMKVETVKVRIGLVNASLLSMILLASGSA